MRTKTIILGAIAALAVATVTVYAGNAPQRSAHGSVMSLVAASTALAKADRGEASAALQTTSAVKTTTAEATEKPEVEDEAEDEPAKGPVSPACQTAIDNLKALRQPDVAEDAAEKATPGPTDTDKTEDIAEAEHVRAALLAVRTACLPRPSAACQAAIDNLKALRQAETAEDAAERANQQAPSASAIAAQKAEDMAEFQKLSAALKALRTACGERD